MLYWCFVDVCMVVCEGVVYVEVVWLDLFC